MPSRTARRRVAAIALASAAVVSIGGLSTSALLTDTVTVGGNVLSTGRVDITASPATAVLKADNMAPGDSVAAPLTITNSGTTPLRYAMTSTATGHTDLAAGLDFVVRSGISAANCTAKNYTGATTVTAANTKLGGASTISIFGNAAQGQHSGDRTVSSTAGSNSEVLCLTVTLPTTAPNTLASKSTTATFNFAAEQTANN